MPAPLPTENAQDLKTRLREHDDPLLYMDADVLMSAAAASIAELERQLSEANKVTDAVGGMIKAKGRYHTAQWYVNLVAVYDEYLKGRSQ